MYFYKYLSNIMRINSINRITSFSNLFEKLNKIRNFNETKQILSYFNPSIHSVNIIHNRYNNNILNNSVNILDIKHNDGYIKFKLFENKHLESYLIFWDPYSKSPIHNHATNGCYLKVLNGNLLEKKYSYQFKNEVCILKENNIDILNNNEISFIDNTIGYHKIYNPNSFTVSSLHVYSPPNYITSVFN